MAEGVEINFPGPAPYEERTERPFSSDTTKTLSKAQLGVQDESIAQAEREKAKAKDATALDVGKAKIETEGSKAVEAASANTILEKGRVDTAETAKIAQKAEVLRQAQEAIKATPAPSLFADRKGWDKAKLAIGLIAAGIGDAITAKSNATLGRASGPSAVTDIIGMELERQRANIQKLTDAQVMAKEGVKDALTARELALSKVDLKGAAMASLAKQHLETLLKAHGMDAAQVAGDERVLSLDRAEIESKKRAVAGLANEHTSTSAKVETVSRTPAADSGASKGQLAIVKNPDGSSAGVAPAAAAAKTNEATNLRVAAVRALKDFHDTAARMGNREINPASDDGRELAGAHASAVAAITSVTNMPGTDKSSLVEAERLGPPGVGVWKVQPKLIKKLASDISAQGRHAIKMTADSAVMTHKSGELTTPELPVSPTGNAPAPAAPAAPTTPPMVPPPAPAAPATPPMVPPAAPVAPAAAPPPRVAGPLSPRDRAALQWAYGPGKGSPRAEEIKRALGVK